MNKRKAKRTPLFTSGEIRNRDLRSALNDKQGMGYQVPPLFAHVLIYLQQQDLSLTEAQEFYRHHEEREWQTVTGKPQKNWKVLATEWIFNHRQEVKLRQRIAVNKNVFSGI